MIRMRKSESGQIAVLSAIFISLFLLAFAALAVDVGFLYASRRNLQTVADAAAIAGANALNSGLTCTSGSCAAAQDVATLNGYTNGVNGVTVTPVVPPTVKPNPSDGTYVEIDVSQPVPTYFLRALNIPTVNVGAKAVAGFAPTPNCIVQLNQTDSNALVVSGSANVTATGCNVAVDSDSTSGLVVSGSGVLDAGSVGVAAPSESQASDAGSPGGQGVTPAYVVNTPNVVDPYASLAPPSPCASRTVGGCTVATCTKTNFTSTSSQTIGPGTYCGGITVSGGTLTLTTGTYILVGGGLTTSGNSATITDGTTATADGVGVTFYFTYPTGNPGKYGTLNIQGGSTANLSAPAKSATSGIPGILFFQDPTAGGSNPGNQKNVVSASNGTLNGVLYFPTQNLRFQGNTAVSVDNVTMVADTLTFTGSADVGSPAASAETTGITTTKLYE
jgi:Putative Flp pilus-assembly TadE/G-like